MLSMSSSLFFFFNDTATPEISTLPLHDPLPISHEYAGLSITRRRGYQCQPLFIDVGKLPGQLLTRKQLAGKLANIDKKRSEEHTSELQSPDHLVCSLLLEKKKKTSPHQSPPPHP